MYDLETLKQIVELVGRENVTRGHKTLSVGYVVTQFHTDIDYTWDAHDILAAGRRKLWEAAAADIRRTHDGLWYWCVPNTSADSFDYPTEPACILAALRKMKPKVRYTVGKSDEEHFVLDITRAIAECPNESDAARIAAALNAMDEKGGAK